MELDLVLADGAAVDRRELGLGEDRRRGSGRATGSPFVRVDDEAGQGLRVEVGRLLGHDVAVARRPPRSTATGVGSSRNAASAPSRPRVDAVDRLGGRLRVGDRAPAATASASIPSSRSSATPSSVDVEARARPRRRPAGSGSNASRRAVRSAPPARVHSPNRPSPPGASAGRLEPRRAARPRSTSRSTSNSSPAPVEQARRRRRRRGRGRPGASAGPSAARRSARGTASGGSRRPGPPRTSGSSAARRDSAARSRSGGARRRW